MSPAPDAAGEAEAAPDAAGEVKAAPHPVQIPPLAPLPLTLVGDAAATCEGDVCAI